jgi:hypothetical protein
VALEEKSPPKKDTHWSIEGTFAHELLEKSLKGEIIDANDFRVTPEMLGHVRKVALKIKSIAIKNNAPLLIEKKVFNTFIHAEMFGTCDAIIPVYGKTLHIIDFKYGAGHIVDPTKNTQLIQYALGAAESYDWAFKTAELHIMQPRGGDNWHKTWAVSIEELKNIWLPTWAKGVARVEKNNSKPYPGSWCHFCGARGICPAKAESKFNKVTKLFNDKPLTNEV